MNTAAQHTAVTHAIIRSIDEQLKEHLPQCQYVVVFLEPDDEGTVHHCSMGSNMERATAIFAVKEARKRLEGTGDLPEIPDPS